MVIESTYYKIFYKDETKRLSKSISEKGLKPIIVRQIMYIRIKLLQTIEYMLHVNDWDVEKSLVKL